MAPWIPETDFFYDTASLSSIQDDAIYEKPKHKPPRRRVTFASMVSVREVMNNESYTNAEREASFYTSNEKRRMRQAAKTEAVLFANGRFVVDKDSSIRGLKVGTRQEIVRKQSLRNHAYAAVLGYQYLYHNDAIADAYQEYSREFAMEARQVARRDEIEAWKVYDAGILAFCDQFLPR